MSSNTNVSDSQDYLKNVNNKFFTTLTDYLVKFNDYVQTNQPEKKAELIQTNDAMINMVKDVQTQSSQKKTAATQIINDFYSSGQKANFDENIHHREQDLASAQHLVVQTQQLYRYEQKIFWLRLILLILLVIVIGWLYWKLMKSPHEGYGTQIANTAKTVISTATGAVSGAVNQITGVKFSGPAK